MNDISPRMVLDYMAAWIPPKCREHIVVVGSLAAGYQLLDDDSLMMRTKDVDCVVFPRIKAVENGRVITEKLLADGWEPRKSDGRGIPGTSSTPDDELSAVRLYPPQSKNWFFELLTVPASENDSGKKWTRMVLSSGGHYGLPSYKYLSLTTFKPVKTGCGIFCARPELMALANMLENPEIKPARMSGPIEGRQIKRSNKDLGRALAIARLSDESMESWPAIWEESMRDCFPSTWLSEAGSAGSGIRKLLGSEEDLDEAFHTCAYGLLAHTRLTMDQLRISGRRLIQDAIEPFEERIRQLQK